jgi:hypothetical protein
VALDLSRAIPFTIGPWEFTARLEEEAAPKTWAAFKELLPFGNTLIQARWIGA